MDKETFIWTISWIVIIPILLFLLILYLYLKSKSKSKKENILTNSLIFSRVLFFAVTLPLKCSSLMNDLVSETIWCKIISITWYMNVIIDQNTSIAIIFLVCSTILRKTNLSFNSVIFTILSIWILSSAISCLLVFLFDAYHTEKSNCIIFDQDILVFKVFAIIISAEGLVTVVSFLYYFILFLAGKYSDNKNESSFIESNGVNTEYIKPLPSLPKHEIYSDPVKYAICLSCASSFFFSALPLFLLSLVSIHFTTLILLI